MAVDDELLMRIEALENRLVNLNAMLDGLDPVREDVDEIRGDIEDHGSQLERGHMLHVHHRGEDSYPYGDMWNFGIEFEGDAITVHPGLLYHVGGVHGLNVAKTVSGLSDNDVVCLLYDPYAYSSTAELAVGVREPYCDHDGEIIRALCRVSVSGGVAVLKQWYGGGIEIGMIGM